MNGLGDNGENIVIKNFKYQEIVQVGLIYLFEGIC